MIDKELEGELEAIVAEGKRLLAKRLLAWAEIQEALERIEAQITEQVLAMGESVVVGDVRASYYKPSIGLDYAGALKAHEDQGPEQALAVADALKQATAVRETVSHSKACLILGLDVPEDESKGKPGRVVIKWDK